MDQYLIEELSKRLKIAPEHIVREYYEMLVLQEMSEQDFMADMIFYGGTALRLAYASPRFSEDLDFLMLRPIPKNAIETILLSICKKDPLLELVEVHEKHFTLFSMLKIIHPTLRHHRHIKIEICKKGNGINYEYRKLTSPCSPFKPYIQTITLPSLQQQKEITVRERQKPRDWVDLWYLAQELKKPFQPGVPFPFENSEFRRECKRHLGRSDWRIIDIILQSVHKTKLP